MYSSYQQSRQLAPRSQNDCPPNTFFHPGFYRDNNGGPHYVRATCGSSPQREIDQGSTPSPRRTDREREPIDQYDCPPNTYYRPGYYREYAGRSVYIKGECSNSPDLNRHFDNMFQQLNVFPYQGSPPPIAPKSQYDCPPGTVYQPSRVSQRSGRPYYREASCQYPE